jgi:hypothetical protein
MRTGASGRGTVRTVLLSGPGAGDDVLHNRLRGVDTVTGKAGNDRLVYNAWGLNAARDKPCRPSGAASGPATSNGAEPLRAGPRLPVHPPQGSRSRSRMSHT